MRKFIALVLMIPILFASACISDTDDGGEGKIGIVVSIPPYYEWASMVGGENVEVTILIPEGQSPHTYEPTPSQMIKVSEASIWVKNGVGLEFWADKVIENNSDIDIVDISEGIDLIPIDGGYDAHVWLSIINAMNGVQSIYESLSGIDPENADYYRENMESYLEDLEAMDRYLKEKLESASGNRFIVFHPAWSYFSREYGLEQIAIEEDGKEPGPEMIVSIIEMARDYGINVIFVEPQFSIENAQVIANEIDGVVISINPLSSDYIENMRTVANALVEGLA
ncbi:MAG: zinc ABC transporter substrate-binding protein [Candidatus Methanofastidiosa archaeon]|nr:zinc ABC transporter substrate-binding protein [Candidatus Methanofastidiosa archaeon]